MSRLQGAIIFKRYGPLKVDAFAKIWRMARQKFRPTRPGGFSGAKAYIRYVEVLKNCRNAAGRTFCDAIKVEFDGKYGLL